MPPGNHVNGKHVERITPILNRLHREIGVLEECTDALLEDAMTQMRSGGAPPSKPLITGWSIQLTPDGRHHFVPFGNARLSLEGVEEGWREPHMSWSVDEDAKQLHVEAELPGVRKDEVEVQVEPDLVRIKAEGKDRRYEAELTPGVLLGSRCRGEYDNGVLRLTKGLAKRKRAKPRDVKITGYRARAAPPRQHALPLAAGPGVRCSTV
jgi:HSP20 family molecular chaperone IbpA